MTDEEFIKKLREWRIICAERRMRAAVKRLIIWIVLCIAPLAFAAYFLAKQITAFRWMNALWYSIAAIVASIFLALIMTEKSNIACARWRIRYEYDEMHRKINVPLSLYKTSENVAMMVNSEPDRFIIFNESNNACERYRVNDKLELEKLGVRRVRIKDILKDEKEKKNEKRD